MFIYLFIYVFSIFGAWLKKQVGNRLLTTVTTVPWRGNKRCVRNAMGNALRDRSWSTCEINPRCNLDVRAGDVTNQENYPVTLSHKVFPIAFLMQRSSLERESSNFLLFGSTEGNKTFGFGTWVNDDKPTSVLSQLIHRQGAEFPLKLQS